MFEKLDGFLVLKKNSASEMNRANIPIYYLSIDVILQGDGMKGKIELCNDKNLESIKCFNNILYVVI